MPWQRVYGFPASAMVKFQHGPHVRAHVACATCHGDMTQATTAQWINIMKLIIRK